MCEEWLRRIQYLKFDLSDSRTKRIAKSLLSIHNFMDKYDKGIDFLNYYLIKQ